MNKIFVFLCAFFLFTASSFALEYNYLSTRSIPIQVSITEEISANMPIHEGQKLYFKVLQTVYDGNKPILIRGEIISGRIDTIVTGGKNNSPAEIYIDHFEISGISQSQIIGTYTKRGLNKSWIYPFERVLTLFSPSGSLINFIKDTQAKIKTSDIITIQYYPDWKKNDIYKMQDDDIYL